MRREITKRYNYLSSEINSLYHQAAKKMGISDSVQNILYVLCDQGNQALQSEICSISGISRQTINSALSTLEQQGLVRVDIAGDAQDVFRLIVLNGVAPGDDAARLHSLLVAAL